MTRILAPTPAHLALASQQLRHGSLVAMPTETVYGLAGHALDPAAVASIFAVKERPTFDPLIVHIASSDPFHLGDLADRWALVDLTEFSPSAKQSLQALLESVWPGPLTVVLPKDPQVPDLVTSGYPTVAVRMPRHPVAQALIQTAGIPLAAPSANRFGRISPTSAQAVWDELAGRVDVILDGGVCEVGVESTVIQMNPNGSWLLLRPGAVTADRIRSFLPFPELTLDPSRSVVGQAPGMLDSHYAPGKPLFLLSQPIRQYSPQQLQQLKTCWPYSPQRVGILTFMGEQIPLQVQLEKSWGIPVFVAVLSPAGEVAEAAHSLFAQLRRLDQSSAQLLLTEPCPWTKGLGHALSDRLRRASRPLEP